jgi:Family of unknown function (DUF5681)
MTRQAIQTNNEPCATDGKVGYKHPPVKSQFRKGQSGNPRGRRKGQRNLPAVLAEVLRQTVTVKQDGKAQRMSKGEALIRILLTKAHNGDRRAIKAMIELSEKIGRIEIADLKLGGHGNYEFMLIPGMAASAEEWQREIDARHETADLREAIAAARATTGTLPTGSQIAALRESIATARASGNSHTPTRRPVNRINKSALKPDPTLEQPKGEAAPQMPAAQATPPRLQRSPTGTYRKVNRRPPDSPNEVSDA